MKAVDFTFEKPQLKNSKPGDDIELKMKVANFFVRMLVDPIGLQFDPVSKKMSHFCGRTPLRVQINGKWRPYDAEILYP